MGKATGCALIDGDGLAVDLRVAETAYRGRDYPAAFDVYHRLGEAGHVDSQLMVAWMLLKGLGVPPDEVAAATWYARSAALGSPQGGFYYGRYLTRLGRHTEARAFYFASARAGYVPSVFWVGYSAARGQGTKVDLDEAYRYLNQAAKRGHLHAVRELGMLDMRGHRGIACRLVGVVEFVTAVVGAFILGLFNRDSDLLRA